MRIKIFLLAIVCSFGVIDAYAQKGVDNGTPYGSGEDSIRCVQNLSLFTSYAKSNNFKDAYEFWKIVYDECPGATKNIYLYGAQILGWWIENEQDPAKKEAWIEDLMTMYDKRVQYFGNDKQNGKDWIIARKAQDYNKYMGDKADPKVFYGWLKDLINEFGNNTDPLGVSLYMFSSYRMLANDESHRATYVGDYLKASEIYDAQLAAATAANNEKDVNLLTSFKQGIDGAFVNSGAADCETLANIYAPKIEENKDNMDFLKETIALLRRMRCTESEVYFAASEYVHEIAPTAESAIGMASRALKRSDQNAAMEYFEQAAELDTDNVAKAENYYRIALILADQKQYAKSRQYALKAIESNGNYGQPYILIAQMYAGSAQSIYPNDAVMRKTVFLAAMDKLERARSVDPSVASEANSLINNYKNHIPTTEEVFMHPDLKKGETITIPGWINERTTIR